MTLALLSCGGEVSTPRDESTDAAAPAPTGTDTRTPPEPIFFGSTRHDASDPLWESCRPSELLDVAIDDTDAGLACTAPLPAEPFDPERINVRTEHADTGTQWLAFFVPSLDECVQQPSWTYDDRDAPTRIRLCPSLCELAADGALMRVQFGCYVDGPGR